MSDLIGNPVDFLMMQLKFDNPFKPSGLNHFQQLDKSIFNFRGVMEIFFIKLLIVNSVQKTVTTVQTALQKISILL